MSMNCLRRQSGEQDAVTTLAQALSAAQVGRRRSAPIGDRNTTGAYQLRDENSVSLLVFKPEDEETGAALNPRGHSQAQLRAGVKPGGCASREAAAFLLDHKGFASVPPTALAFARDAGFNYDASSTAQARGKARAAARRRREARLRALARRRQDEQQDPENPEAALQCNSVVAAAQKSAAPNWAGLGKSLGTGASHGGAVGVDQRQGGLLSPGRRPHFSCGDGAGASHGGAATATTTASESTRGSTQPIGSCTAPTSDEGGGPWLSVRPLAGEGGDGDKGRNGDESRGGTGGPDAYFGCESLERNSRPDRSIRAEHAQGTRSHNQSAASEIAPVANRQSSSDVGSSHADSHMHPNGELSPPVSPKASPEMNPADSPSGVRPCVHEDDDMVGPSGPLCLGAMKDFVLDGDRERRTSTRARSSREGQGRGGEGGGGGAGRRRRAGMRARGPAADSESELEEPSEDAIAKYLPLKLGSVQLFVPHACSAEDVGTGLWGAEQVHRIGILDVRLCNLDRNEDNILIRPYFDAHESDSGGGGGGGRRGAAASRQSAPLGHQRFATAVSATGLGEHGEASAGSPRASSMRAAAADGEQDGDSRTSASFVPPAPLDIALERVESYLSGSASSGVDTPDADGSATPGRRGIGSSLQWQASSPGPGRGQKGWDTEGRTADRLGLRDPRKAMLSLDRPHTGSGSDVPSASLSASEDVDAESDDSANSEMLDRLENAALSSKQGAVSFWAQYLLLQAQERRERKRRKRRVLRARRRRSPPMRGVGGPGGERRQKDISLSASGDFEPVSASCVGEHTRRRGRGGSDGVDEEDPLWSEGDDAGAGACGEPFHGLEGKGHVDLSVPSFSYSASDPTADRQDSAASVHGELPRASPTLDQGLVLPDSSPLRGPRDAPLSQQLPQMTSDLQSSPMHENGSLAEGFGLGLGLQPLVLGGTASKVPAAADHTGRFPPSSGANPLALGLGSFVSLQPYQAGADQITVSGDGEQEGHQQLVEGADLGGSNLLSGETDVSQADSVHPTEHAAVSADCSSTVQTETASPLPVLGDDSRFITRSSSDGSLAALHLAHAAPTTRVARIFSDPWSATGDLDQAGMAGRPPIVSPMLGPAASPGRQLVRSRAQSGRPSEAALTPSTSASGDAATSGTGGDVSGDLDDDPHELSMSGPVSAAAAEAVEAAVLSGVQLSGLAIAERRGIRRPPTILSAMSSASTGRSSAGSGAGSPSVRNSQQLTKFLAGTDADAASGFEGGAADSIGEDTRTHVKSAGVPRASSAPPPTAPVTRMALDLGLGSQDDIGALPDLCLTPSSGDISAAPAVSGAAAAAVRAGPAPLAHQGVHTPAMSPMLGAMRPPLPPRNTRIRGGGQAMQYSEQENTAVGRPARVSEPHADGQNSPQTQPQPIASQEPELHLATASANSSTGTESKQKSRYVPPAAGSRSGSRYVPPSQRPKTSTSISFPPVTPLLRATATPVSTTGVLPASASASAGSEHGSPLLTIRAAQAARGDDNGTFGGFAASGTIENTGDSSLNPKPLATAPAPASGRVRSPAPAPHHRSFIGVIKQSGVVPEGDALGSTPVSGSDGANPPSAALAFVLGAREHTGLRLAMAEPKPGAATATVATTAGRAKDITAKRRALSPRIVLRREQSSGGGGTGTGAGANSRERATGRGQHDSRRRSAAASRNRRYQGGRGGGRWHSRRGLYSAGEVPGIGVLPQGPGSVGLRGMKLLRAATRLELIPIDHGLCLPDADVPEALADVNCSWLFWRQAKEPFSDDSLNFIAELNGREDAMQLWDVFGPAGGADDIRDAARAPGEQGVGGVTKGFEGSRISPGALLCLRICTLLLQLGAAAGLTLHEIGRLMIRGPTYSQADLELTDPLADSKTLQLRYHRKLPEDAMRKPFRLPRRDPSGSVADGANQSVQDGTRLAAGSHDSGREQRNRRSRSHRTKQGRVRASRVLGSSDLGSLLGAAANSGGRSIASHDRATADVNVDIPALRLLRMRLPRLSDVEPFLVNPAFVPRASLRWFAGGVQPERGWLRHRGGQFLSREQEVADSSAHLDSVVAPIDPSARLGTGRGTATGSSDGQVGDGGRSPSNGGRRDGGTSGGKSGTSGAAASGQAGLASETEMLGGRRWSGLELALASARAEFYKRRAIKQRAISAIPSRSSQLSLVSMASEASTGTGAGAHSHLAGGSNEHLGQSYDVHHPLDSATNRIGFNDDIGVRSASLDALVLGDTLPGNSQFDGSKMEEVVPVQLAPEVRTHEPLHQVSNRRRIASHSSSQMGVHAKRTHSSSFLAGGLIGGKRLGGAAAGGVPPARKSRLRNETSVGADSGSVGAPSGSNSLLVGSAVVGHGSGDGDGDAPGHRFPPGAGSSSSSGTHDVVVMNSANGPTKAGGDAAARTGADAVRNGSEQSRGELIPRAAGSKREGPEPLFAEEQDELVYLFGQAIEPFLALSIVRRSAGGQAGLFG